MKQASLASRFDYIAGVTMVFVSDVWERFFKRWSLASGLRLAKVACPVICTSEIVSVARKVS